MTAEQAKKLVANAMLEASELCKEKGLVADARAYYSDKALRECAEFNDSVILLFGAVRLGVEGMDEDDMCTYGLCCEIKLGEVDDAELEKEICDFNADLEKILEEILASSDREKTIIAINERQENEAAESMKEFDLEMKKMKLKLYSALGIFAFIAAAMIIVGFIL